MDIVDFVVREHVGMAAFLWVQHTVLSAEDPPDRAALATVAARLEAHLDGIALAGVDAWPFNDAAFAVAVLARFAAWLDAGVIAASRD